MENKVKDESPKLVRKKVNPIEKLKLGELIELREATNLICEEYESSLVANRNEPSFREIYNRTLEDFNKYKNINKQVFLLIKHKIDKIFEEK